MPYCSPEQIRGEAIDLRSNLFTLGAILYEMVVGRKAFDAADPVALVSAIENEMPASPVEANSKVHPAVSALIMKALAKDPAERYQSARELLDDLEKCKENGRKAAVETKKTAAAPNAVVSRADRAVAASKFVSAATSAAEPERCARPVASKPAPPAAAKIDAPAFSQGVSMAAENRAAAASASAVNGGAGQALNAGFDAKSELKSDAKSGARPIGDFEVSAPESPAACGPVLSAAAAAMAVEREPERHSARVAVDPTMSEPVTSASGKSFSDLAEMPPLKEPVFAPPMPEPVAPARPVAQIYPKREEKPKIQPREVAQRAMNQIASVPPRLMLYAILGAVGLILAIAIGIYIHVRSEDDGSTAAPRPTKAASPAPSAAPAAVAPQPVQAAPPVVEAQPSLTVRQVEKRRSTNVRQAPAPVPVQVVTTGEALIDSSPQGAQFQVDGKSDPSWVTPFNVMGLSLGKHIVYGTKSGYTSEMRSIDVATGGKASVVLHLSPVNALMVVNSAPPGAEIAIDGKPTGRVTPAQFAVEKGSHTVLLRKQGYLDESVTADLGPAQNFQYSPALRALGNTENMRTSGKLGKLFGRGGDSTAGMGAISVRTQPKGAQVSINQRVLDKTSPLEVMLGPGNYIVDVTLTGFKPVHKIVTVDKGGKAAIDEVLERQ
jgi:hypothetical protein